MKCFVIGGLTDEQEELNMNNKRRFEKACITIGQAIATSGHSLSICSPFKDSADYWVLKGFSNCNTEQSQVIEFHFVDSVQVRIKIESLQAGLTHQNFIKIPYPAPLNDNLESIRYAWLLCQLQALETCHVVIAIGGKIEGSSNMLLLLAESKNKPILPLSFLGGASGQVFHRKRYELQDKLGTDYLILDDESNITKSMYLLTKLSSQALKDKGEMKEYNLTSFFISYPRANPGDADFIETLLRRRNYKVYRDDSDFGAGHSIQTLINETIYSADVFIATWCKEYACSPWCFDELELALDRYQKGNMKIWIFCTDDTRIIPKRGRDLSTYSVKSRDEILGVLLNLLGKNRDSLLNLE
jgi:hypothetical protein